MEIICMEKTFKAQKALICGMNADKRKGQKTKTWCTLTNGLVKEQWDMRFGG